MTDENEESVELISLGDADIYHIERLGPFLEADPDFPDKNLLVSALREFTRYLQADLVWLRRKVTNERQRLKESSLKVFSDIKRNYEVKGEVLFGEKIYDATLGYNEFVILEKDTPTRQEATLSIHLDLAGPEISSLELYLITGSYSGPNGSKPGIQLRCTPDLWMIANRYISKWSKWYKI